MSGDLSNLLKHGVTKVTKTHGENFMDTFGAL
jgi:hypothetical protein